MAFPHTIRTGSPMALEAVPTRSQLSLRHSRPRSQQSHPSTSRSDPRRPSSSTSPEIIASLIISLSNLPSPTLTPTIDGFGSSSNLPSPSSPNGSFGVEYGAFASSPPRSDSLVQNGPPIPLDINELAASSPVIRTSKPPSGLSPVTAPKSSSREPVGLGIRSILCNNSSPNAANASATARPPSRSSSAEDDAHSIGSLSIERGCAASPLPELRRQRSHDSWGKKQKNIMYMSSRERLRDREIDNKRAIVAVGSINETLPPAADFMAEMAMREEQNSGGARVNSSRRDSFGASSTRLIPQRDSSLRKAGSSATRSSNHRSKRDGEPSTPTCDIPEAEEKCRREDFLKRQGDVARTKSPEHMPTKVTILPNNRQVSETFLDVYQNTGHVASSQSDDDGAPFPAVAQGRRRDEHSAERMSRRLSDRFTPDSPVDLIRPKRRSSRIKRLSQATSAKEERPEPPRKDQSEPVASRPPAYERPRSADSVDDAVESYLCSPRLSQKIKHPQTGRVISFSEVGDAGGSAVFCCVGMGLTRYITAFYDELASTLKLRLITPDRPGVGDSEPYTDGATTPLSWPDDVYAICQALKINKFSILAHSAGAIYALAAALRMPQHIRGRIHLLAPWIPPSQMSTFGSSQAQPPSTSLPTAQRILRALPTPILKVANSSFMSATSSSITSSLPKTPRLKRKATRDKENDQSGATNSDGLEINLSVHENMDRIRPQTSRATLTPRPDAAAAEKERQALYDIRLTHAIWELATTNANPAVDLLVCLERRHTIGFRYVDITRPVVIHHGSRDSRVPVDNVKWLGKMMRRCEVRVLEGESHGLMASATVMGGVLMEIGKEWEDWVKATGGNQRGRERERRGTIRG